MQTDKFLKNSKLIIATMLLFAACATNAKAENGTDQAQYFINPKYMPKMTEAFKKAQESINPALFSKLTSFDFRGWRMGMNYDATFKVAADEHVKGCQNTLYNFYSVSAIVGTGDERDSGNMAIDKNSKISQGSVPCGDDTGFSFSPLGRLNGYQMTFWSEEEAAAVMKRLEAKMPNEKWVYLCTHRNGNDCVYGSMGLSLDGGNTLNVNLDFNNEAGKKLEGDKILYKYTIEVSSHYLDNIDTAALKAVLLSSAPKTPTRM